MTIPKYGRIHLCFDHGTYVQYMGFTHWLQDDPWFEHLSSVIVYHCHQYSQYIPETGGKKSTTNNNRNTNNKRNNKNRRKKKNNSNNNNNNSSHSSNNNNKVSLEICSDRLHHTFKLLTGTAYLSRLSKSQARQRKELDLYDKPSIIYKT